MLAYVSPILLLIVVVLALGSVLTKSEKQRHMFRNASRIVCLLLGIVFLIMVIGLVTVFIQLNF